MEYLNGIAWADYCCFEYNGKKYDVSYNDDACLPYPFGYFRNPDTNTFDFRIGGIGMSHEDLRFRPKYSISQPDGLNKNYNPSKEERDTGRVYFRDKLLVFWNIGIPDKATVRKVLSDLSQAFNEELWMKPSFNDFLLCGEISNEKMFVVPISEFLGQGNSMADSQKRQRSQLAMDKRLGLQNLANWEKNDPHADKMYRDVVEESVEMRGYASPDSVNCCNDEMGWDCRGTYDDTSIGPIPFGYLNGEMLVGDFGWKHISMVYYAKHHDELDDWDGDEFDLEYDSDGNQRNGYGDGFNELEYPGRVWLDGGFICFWDWNLLKMNRHKMAKIIKDLEGAIYNTWGEKFDLYQYILLYPDEDNNLLGCLLKNYISGTDDNTDKYQVAIKNKAKSDTVLSKAHGEQDLAKWYAESPYADRMYKNVMEKKIAKELKKILREYLTYSHE